MPREWAYAWPQFFYKALVCLHRACATGPCNGGTAYNFGEIPR